MTWANQDQAFNVATNRDDVIDEAFSVSRDLGNLAQDFFHCDVDSPSANIRFNTFNKRLMQLDVWHRDFLVKTARCVIDTRCASATNQLTFIMSALFDTVVKQSLWRHLTQDKEDKYRLAKVLLVAITVSHEQYGFVDEEHVLQQWTGKKIVLQHELRTEIAAAALFGEHWPILYGDDLYNPRRLIEAIDASRPAFMDNTCVQRTIETVLPKDVLF